VKNLSSAELRAIKLRDQFGESASTIPLLRDVAQWVAVVEIKPPDAPQLVERVVEIMAGRDWALQSFDQANLLHLNRIEPSIPVAFLIDRPEGIDTAIACKWPAYVDHTMIGARGAMLPSPTADEKLAAAPLIEKLEVSRQKVFRECARIAKSSTLTHELQSVVQPIYLEDKHIRAAKASSLFSTLQTLRSQIELYKLQHLDELPDFKSLGWNPLTQRTNAAGKLDTGDFGPYMRSEPRNPVNGQSRILLIRGNPKADFETTSRDCGFVIDQNTGRIWGLDTDGRIFDENAPTADTR
jgi:hypothetical protein